MMDGCRLRARFAFWVSAVMLTSLAPLAVQAQIGGGGFGGGGFGGGGVGGGGLGGGGGVGVGGNFQNAGVVVDAQGVLRVQRLTDQGGLQAKRIVQAAMASLDPKLAKRSALRKISLNRLEKAVASRWTAASRYRTR